MPVEIVDPVRRQRMSFVCENDVLHAEVWTEPGGDVPAHHHPAQTERFEVVSGEVEFRIGRTSRRAGPGDRVVAEPGVVHAFKNSGEVPALVRVEVQPALRMQAFLEEAAALAREGKYTQRGVPRGLRAAAELAEFMERYSDVTVMAFPPRPLQRLLRLPLARLAPSR
jgi:mannose-6-phosphate isomerase-like protein (cupin superfamily)